MKKFLKAEAIFLILIFAISLLLNNNVYAATEECKMQLSADKTTLNIGDEVTLTVKVSDIASGEAIQGIVGTLNYPQDIFEIEYITDSQIEENIALSDMRTTSGIDNLKVVYYSESGWYILCGEVANSDGAALYAETTGSDPIESSQEIGTIKLKVKDSAITTTTPIKVTDINIENAEGNTSSITTEPSVNFTVNALTSSGGSSSGNSGSSGGTSSGTKNNTGANTGINTSTKNTSANTSAPYTGAKEVAPIILIVTIIAVVVFIKLIKYKDIK